MMKNKLLSFGIITTVGAAITNRLISSRASYASHRKLSYYNWTHGRTAYELSGTGTPILLLHSLNPNSCSLEWQHTIPALAKQHTVYAPDFPGCGESEKPQITYTNFFYVSFLRDFICNVIKEKVIIVASGESATVALMTTHFLPDMIEKIFLVDPAPVVTGSDSRSWKCRFAKILFSFPVWGNFFYNLLHTRKRIDKLFRGFPNATLLVKQSYGIAHNQNSSGRFLYGSSVANYTSVDLTATLKNMTIPISVLFSANSCKYRSIAEQYHSLLPAVQTKSIAHTTHLPQLEKPQLFTSTILSLI